VAYTISGRHGCDGSIYLHHASTHRWRALFLYATAMVVAVAYTFPVRLRYVAVAYINFCMPRKTIPPIAIFLVVLNPMCVATELPREQTYSRRGHALPLCIPPVPRLPASPASSRSVHFYGRPLPSLLVAFTCVRTNSKLAVLATGVSSVAMAARQVFQSLISSK
jgi:hypothetical protein